MMTDPTPDVRHPVEGQREAAEELCPCGKPASHLQLPDDDREWACLVPNFDPATGVLLPPVGRYAPSTTSFPDDTAAGADPEAVLAAHAAQLEQPAWAARRYYSHDIGNEGAVVYQWDAPTRPGLANNTEAGEFPLEVSLVQSRLLTLTPTGVAVEDDEVAVHCEAGDLWLSPSDAMDLALALISCAARATPAGGDVTAVGQATQGSPDRVQVQVEGGMQSPFVWLPSQGVLLLRPGTRAETAAALRDAAVALGASA